MRVNEGEIERRQIQIRIRNSDKHRLINRRIALVHFIRWLPRPALVRPSNLKRGIRGVDLRNPGQELGLASRCRGDVAVVGSNGLAGVFPLKEDFAAGEGQGLGLVARDGGRTVVAGCGIVHAGFDFG